MDPITAMLILGGIQTGLGFLGGDGPEPQRRSSFRGTPADPVSMLTRASRGIEGMLGPTMERAGTPARLRTVAQTPSFNTNAGGALPFNIGLSGMDQGMFDPSVLTGRGMNISSLLSQMSGQGGSFPGWGNPGPRTQGSSSEPTGARARNRDLEEIEGTFEFLRSNRRR